MLIYAEKITSRLQYIAEVFFGECSFTSDVDAFHRSDNPKINYSYKRFSETEFHILPAGLLNETGIRKHPFTCFGWKGLKVFFSTKGDIPFDIFSAAFFLLSRYEEYLPHKKDSYGRFAHTESLAFKEGFLQRPLVNEWMNHFYLALQEKFPGYKAPLRTFRFIPTYDIDIAFAGGGGWLRKLTGLIRRKQTKINGQDIFDVYSWLHQLHSDSKLSPIYFFLLAKHRSKYDKNLSPKSGKFQQLVRDISARYATGIHPSWQSYHDEQLLLKEIHTLQNLTGKKVTASRQHYIQFTLPHTYRNLVASGITDDHSMGYGSINGFRASFALPFYWYDLMKEEKTSILLHPFCYMEANSHFEQQLTVDEAAKELEYYYTTVRDVKGECITIFHNHFLTVQPQWLPWREMYERFLKSNFIAPFPEKQS